MTNDFSNPNRTPGRLAAWLLLLGVVFGAGAAHGQGFRLEDVRDDDHGTGSLFYPNRVDVMEGDLDLLWLEAVPADGGTWFRAGFKNPIRSPSGQVTRIGQEPLERLARHDFYTFNLDIYIDIDRVENSGSVDTMPGRGVVIDARDAWERCVVLTPRPTVAARLLEKHAERTLIDQTREAEGRLSEARSKQIRDGVKDSVGDRIFFPTKIRVRGREVRFFVPDEFLGQTASRDWTYTALVTGADAEQQSKVVSFSNDGFGLMTSPLARGRHEYRFGLDSRADPETPPVIDLLSATPAAQESMLATYDVRDGRLAMVSGVSPAGGPTGPPRRRAAPTSGVMAAAPRSGVTTAPAEPTVREAPPTAPAAAPTARRSIADRLRTLNDLKDQGLITEQEYQALRRKVLSEI